MAINQDIVGRIYPPAGTYTVGREKIREFAASVKAESPCILTWRQLRQRATLT